MTQPEEKLNELLEEIKKLRDDNPNLSLTTVKTEVDNMFGTTGGATQSSSTANVSTELVDALSRMTFATANQLSKYVEGSNFARHCEKFVEYAELTQLPARNAYKLFLHNVDDRTYSILKEVNITEAEKASMTLFIPKLKEAIYSDDSFSLKITLT